MAKPKNINWAKTLQTLSGKQGNEPEGEGWFTAIEFQENAGVGHARCHKLIRKGLENGSLEMHRGSSWNENHKQLTRKVWYRQI